MNIGRSKDDPLSKDAELTDLARQWLQDQAEWIDSVLKQLMPEPLYRAAHRGKNLDVVEKFLHNNDLQLVHMFQEGRPCGLRMMQGLRVIAELRQVVHVDDSIRHPFEDP